jgi:cytochrome c-type biogenesis protein CcmH/NrfF
MTALQLFVLFGLPLVIGIVGVLAAIMFRRRHARSHPQTNPSA